MMKMILINSVKNLSWNKCNSSHGKWFEGFAYFNDCKQKILTFETIIEINGTVYRHGRQ